MTAAVAIDTAPTGTDPVDALRGTWREVSRSYAAYLAAMVEAGHAEAATPGPLRERHHLMKHRGGWHLAQPEPGRFVCTRPES